MITEGQLRLIARYYRGRGREFAFLELAQEHLLVWMEREGMFAGGPDDLVFKGGTALRKFRLGPRGRFSTGLDFAVAHRDFADHVIESLVERLINVDGVSFRASYTDAEAGKARWIASVDGLGDTMETKIEFTKRPTLLAPVVPSRRPEISGVTPDLLGFPLPLVPLMRLEENLAEKLARFRRVIRSRDLYDLAEMGREVRGQIDLVRHILCFKVYFDIVRDGRVSPAPFRAGAEYVGRTVAEIVDPEDLGLIMGERVDYTRMLDTVAAMFGPMGAPTGPIESRLALIDRGDLFWADQEYERLRAGYRAAPPEGDHGFDS